MGGETARVSRHEKTPQSVRHDGDKVGAGLRCRREADLNGTIHRELRGLVSTERKRVCRWRYCQRHNRHIDQRAWAGEDRRELDEADSSRRNRCVRWIDCSGYTYTAAANQQQREGEKPEPRKFPIVTASEAHENTRISKPL